MSKNVTIDDISGPEGQWLVVVKGRVIASSSELLDMLKLAEKYPEADTLVTMVLYPRASFF
ncbi:MAG: hypothetical protein A3K67_06865 [Euryarchaeota archaeon RBG_16_62_10]|nr:MAG: hypothetical protein A3K67_06865 [Euryarchaeota archaeon RBG_16_62_10]